MKIKKILAAVSAAALICMPVMPKAETAGQYTDTDGTVYKYEEKGELFYITDIIPAEGVSTLNIPAAIDEKELSNLDLSQNYSFAKIDLEKIKTINMPKTVREGFTFKFSGLSSLEEVKLPENITEIPGDAFSKCGGLKSVEIPQNVKILGEACFFECTALESITLPESVSVIGDEAFCGCVRLGNIEWNKTAQLGYDVFENTAYLKNQPGGMLVLNGKLYRYGGSDKIVQIPRGVTLIGEYAFADTEAEKIICPESLEEIGNSSFAHAKKLKTVEFNGSIKSLGMNAFEGCEALRDAIIPDKVDEIPIGCFLGCAAIESVVIPAGIKTVNPGAFYGCTGLKKLIIEGASKIFSGAFVQTGLKRENITVSDEAVYVLRTGDADYKNDALYFMHTEADEPKPDITTAPKPSENPAHAPEVSAAPETTAEPMSQKSIEVFNENGEIRIKADGEDVNFPEAKPFVDENGRTQVPVRFLCEFLNKRVYWFEESRQVIVSNTPAASDDENGGAGGDSIAFAIGEAKYTVNGKEYSMDTEAKIINERTYIPVRFACEALGYSVIWK